MSLSIYISAPYAARDLAGITASRLRNEGFEISSRWIQATHDITPGTIGAAMGSSSEDVAKAAAADLEDLERSDVLLMLTGEYCAHHMSIENDLSLHTGGRHVEMGYAIAKGIPILVVGEPENVFQRSGSILVQDIVQARAALEGYQLGVARSA